MLAGRSWRTTQHRGYPFLLKRCDGILVHERALTWYAGAERHTHMLTIPSSLVFPMRISCYLFIVLYFTRLHHICPKLSKATAGRHKHKRRESTSIELRRRRSRFLRERRYNKYTHVPEFLKVKGRGTRGIRDLYRMTVKHWLVGARYKIPWCKPGQSVPQAVTM